MDGQAIFFELTQGVRQGCPLSPYLFILSAEIMAENVRKTKKISGLTVCGEEIKLSQYADDTTLILDDSEESLRESLTLLDDFGEMSGLKLKCGKTEALWIGSKTNCNLRLCPEKTSNGRLRRLRLLVSGFQLIPR